MEIRNNQLYEKADKLIKTVYGADARFREGQYEAIEAVIENRRVLVVQKTGWGKSLVYFMCTKIFRERKMGVTLVVSPLIVLMENQLEAGQRLGLKCGVLNGAVKEGRKEIISGLVQDEYDLLLITPETLFADDVQKRLHDIKIGLLVIDEAHCISDWGHDFRLEYGNLKKIIPLLPPNVPVLATTATANDRVIKDLEVQLGNGVYVSRGSLMRESLSIQILNIPNKAERYGWILENIGKLPGSGIIYCLTQRDCERLAQFLTVNGVDALPYHSGLDEERLFEAEEAFKHNKIKAIVATIKLGMGYDKGDISFVIHLQMPANIVSYYQQIGRAGRNIDRAYAFLLCGEEDEAILNHFINTAFPTEEETRGIMRVVMDGGAKRSALSAELNIGGDRIVKALSFLMNDGFVQKDGVAYLATPKKFSYDAARYEKISKIRRREIEQMKELARTDGCYGRFVANCLDDFTAKDCGVCANCMKREILPRAVSLEYKQIGADFINGATIEIKPKKMWLHSSVTQYSKMRFSNAEGFSLCRLGEAGYGELALRDKMNGAPYCEELLERSVKSLERVAEEECITAVTCVPSPTNAFTEEFAMRLANSLGLPFERMLTRISFVPQGEMENTAHKCANAFRSFVAADNLKGRVLLVDDVVVSGWTLAVCGYRLMENGIKEVVPFALADGSGS